MKGTRTAVLKAVTQWVEDADLQDDPRTPTLWLSGSAGAGKSAIAQSIAEHCAETNQLAASFFFSRGRPDRNTANHFWPTIAFQLAMTSLELRTRIGKVVEDDPAIFLRSPVDQMEKLIVGPLASLGSLSAKLVVIDGLDECEGSGAYDIWKLVAQPINAYRLPLRFFITSRPEQHICNLVQNPEFQHTRRLITLDESFPPGDDIRLYVRRGFDELISRHPHTMRNIPRPWPPLNEIERLVTLSSASFIYASTVMRFIGDEDHRPTDQLKAVLNAPRSTPLTELDHLYQHILWTSTSSTRSSLLRRILGCLLTAGEPISPDEIENLFSLQQGDVGLILRRMHSVVSVPDSPSRAVTVIHASFVDFLFSPERAGIYYQDPARSHLDLARACLRLARNRGRYMPFLSPCHVY